MTSIRSLNISNKLDLEGTVAKLQKAEENKLKPIIDRQTTYKSQLTSWGIMQTALEKLKTASDNMSEVEGKDFFKASSDSDSIDATVTNKTEAGKYEVEVLQLATPHTLKTKVINSEKENLGDPSIKNNSIKITQKGGKGSVEVKLTNGHTSLQDIKEAINNQGKNFSATIVKSNSNAYHLLLTSMDTGESSELNVSTEDSRLSDYFTFGKNLKNSMIEQSAAKDSIVKIDGIEVTRSGNSIDDAMEGINLKLLKTSNKSVTQIKVEKNEIKVATAIKSFVEAYNSYQTSLKNQTKFSPVKKGASQDSSNGALLGDNSLRHINDQLQRKIISYGNGDISSISQLGVKLESSGKLTLDEKFLDKAIKKDLTSVVKFISGDANKKGFSKQISEEISKYVGSDGIIHSNTDSINRSLTRSSENYSSEVKHIETLMDMYRKQFSMLNKLYDKLDKTSDDLSKSFAKLK